MRFANTEQVIETLRSCAIDPPGLTVRFALCRGLTSSMNSPGTISIFRLSKTLIRYAMLAQTLPNFCRSDRDIDVAHAQMPKRVDNRVRDGCRSAHRGRLANPFRAQRM